MQKFWKTSTLLALLAMLTGAILFSGSNTVEARPKYRTVFQKHYEKVAENNKITCFVCHGKTDGKMDKKKRNIYGMAVGKAMGKTNETDEDKIKAGFGKAEKGKSATEGKTFGDLLEDGKLPAPEAE